MSTGNPPTDEVLKFTDALDAKYFDAGRITNFVGLDQEGAAAWIPAYIYERQAGKTPAQAQAAVFAQIDAVWHPVPPPDPTPTPEGPVVPIVGYLRPAGNHTVGDDSGPRSVRFCSYFPALRDFKDRRDECLRNLDRMRGYWQGVRIFWNLSKPWQPFGKDVNPFWTDFEPLFVEFLHECWARELRISLTAGDLQYLTISQYEAQIPRIAGLCRSVNEQVVAATGMVNEARVNSWPEIGEDWDWWAARSRTWQATYPWGMQGLSDPADQEEPASLKASSRAPATYALLHGTRQSPVDAIRRAFNVRFDGGIGRPINQDEPTNILNPRMTGPNIRVYQPLQTKEQLFGLYSLIVLTGQVLTFFGDCSLTNTTQLPLDDDWGFKELPVRWEEMLIPDDIGLYVLIPGHRAEAPITLNGIPGPASGRCDNIVHPSGVRGYAVVYGETATTPGQWQIRSRQPLHEGRVWTATGPPILFPGSVNLPSAYEAVVVEWHR